MSQPPSCELGQPVSDQLFDGSLYPESLRGTVDELNQLVQDQLVEFEDPHERARYTYFAVLDQIEGTGVLPPRSDAKQFSTRYLPDEFRTHEGRKMLGMAYALRKISHDTSKRLAMSDEPAAVVTAIDRMTVIRAFMYRGGFGDANLAGRTANRLSNGVGNYRHLRASQVASTAHRVIGLLPHENREVFAKDVGDAFGRLVDAIDPIAEHQVMAYATPTNLRDRMLGHTNNGLVQFAERFDPDNIRLFAIYINQHPVRWSGQHAEKYSATDQFGIEMFEDMIQQLGVAVENRSRIKPNGIESALAEASNLVAKTIEATGTQYGTVLAQELEKSRTPMKVSGTNATILSFSSIVKLANSLEGSLRASPVFEDVDIERLDASQIASLPEAFRRLMFIACHGTEGEGLPKELDVERRLAAIDAFADIVPRAIDKRANAPKVAAKVGAVAAKGRGGLPQGVSCWDRWSRGYGYLT